ncbi:MAG: TraB/GumN family protein [Ginsengibacter sp.]
MKIKSNSSLANSLLWKISGKNLTHASYLYGTMHMMCAADFEIKKKVKTALEKCDELVMEFDFTNIDEIVLLEEMNVSTGKISDDLNAKEKKEFQKIITGNFDFSVEHADSMPPMVLINIMLLKSIDCDDIKLFETELIAIAQQKNIKLGGIESATEQMEIAAKVFDSKEILRQLKSATDFKDMFKEMAYSYKREELEKIGSYINDERFLNQDSKETIVMERNRNWIKRMPAFMKGRSVFFAVGAGHLTGSEGVIHLLRKKGYAVHPVFNRKIK